MNAKTLKVLEFNSIKEMLLTHTVSIFGNEIVQQLEPTTDIDEVTKKLNETTEATIAILRRGSPPLGRIPDIRSSLKRADSGAILAPAELLDVSDLLRSSRSMRKYSDDTPKEQYLNIIDGLIEKLMSNKTLEDRINNAIINDEEISDNASDALRSIRRQINETNNSIRDRLNQVVHSQAYQKYLQDSIITIREGRFVIPVKQEFRNEVSGLVHDSSSSGATLFIEPMAVVEANNKLKELKIKERFEIERILSELTQSVVENMQMLENNIRILGILDFIFAKGQLSIGLNAVEPSLNTEGYVKLVSARHPLIEPKRVVPVDVELGKEFKTLLITGPNTGGKTVTLKTLGLFVLMAQSGLHIPARDGSSVAVFDKVFADIGDEQSIEQSLSTFSAHMTNITKIIDEADDKSLCLFDELGAGTDPVEGAALATGILVYLNNINASTVATTHYSELKVFALTNKGFMNASCEFDVETLRPTYRVLMGVPGKSNAFEISRRIGLSSKVIEMSKEYISKESADFEDVLATLKKEKEVAQNERQNAERYRIEIETLRNQLINERKELEKQREKIILQAKEKALEIVKDAKEESEEIISDIRKITREQEEREREKAIQESRDKLKTNLSSLEKDITVAAIARVDRGTKPPKAVKPGEKVYVVNIDQTGEVLTVPDSEGNLMVRVGIMKINSNIKDLRLQKEDKVSFQRIADERKSSAKSLNISSELDLRGQVLDEAVINTDKYLDDATLSGLSQVTIIHGKGTGALRNGIHQFLKHHPHVKSYRLGRYGEGETGVTIVELK